MLALALRMVVPKMHLYRPQHPDWIAAVQSFLSSSFKNCCASDAAMIHCSLGKEERKQRVTHAPLVVLPLHCKDRIVYVHRKQAGFTPLAILNILSANRLAPRRLPNRQTE